MVNQDARLASRWESSPHALSLSPKSRGITKPTEDQKPAGASQNSGAPVIRVVQIFNPVMVKTDVANFRSLVQKLTGKSGCPRYWSKLRKLNCGNGKEESQLREVPTKSLVNSLSIDRFCDSRTHDRGSSMRKPNPSVSSSYERSFSDLDIYAGLVSESPLPDITMLPPLRLPLQTTRELMSLCIN